MNWWIFHLLPNSILGNRWNSVLWILTNACSIFQIIQYFNLSYKLNNIRYCLKMYCFAYEIKIKVMTELFYDRIISRYFPKIKFTLQWLGWFQLDTSRFEFCSLTCSNDFFWISKISLLNIPLNTLWPQTSSFLDLDYK